MTGRDAQPATHAELDAARLVLARMGLAPEDLVGDASRRDPAPTFADYIPKVAAAVSTGTRRVYGSYWNRIVQQWGQRSLDEPTASEIKHLAEHMRSQVVQRRNARGGRGAAEHLIAALRCVYNHASDDGLITEADNPARRVAKPRRLPTTRRGLPESGLDEINRIATSTGNDPALDALLLRLHTETACRRGGALTLRPQDLDTAQCLVLLREKGDTTRWQPVSPTLMQHLHEHAHERSAATSGGQLLRYRDGRPLTTRRYDHLWTRIGQHLPWTATQQISTHWLRHTDPDLEQVEAAIARAIELKAENKHLLFAGDPVPLGEALPAPSVDRIDIAACLLDLSDDAHLARLAKRDRARGDDPAASGLGSLAAGARHRSRVRPGSDHRRCLAGDALGTLGRPPTRTRVGNDRPRHDTIHARASAGRGRRLVRARGRRKRPVFRAGWFRE